MVGTLQAQIATHEKAITDLRKVSGLGASHSAEALLEEAFATQEKLGKEVAYVFPRQVCVPYLSV